MIKERLIREDKSGIEELLLKVNNLRCSYSQRGGTPFGSNNEHQDIIRNVSFAIEESETFALVGESGSGKTTIMRAIAGLLVPTGGKIYFGDIDITKPIDKRSKDLHRKIQIVFQNPDSSLNPRRSIGYAVGRPYQLMTNFSGQALREKTEEALLAVNLDPVYARRYPPQISKGERQRVAIARALAADPSLLLCDEILSALDVSVQASIIDLMIALQEERQLTYLFISHDLAVVRSLAQHVGVLYLGRICEAGKTEEVFHPPNHPYTEVLLKAVPRAKVGQRPSELVIAAGDIKDPKQQQGCLFSPRCPRKLGSICDGQIPSWQEVNGHGLLCHIPRNELLIMQS